NARAFFHNLVSLARFIRPGLPHHKVFLPLTLASPNWHYFKTLTKQWIEKSRWREISRGYLPFILYGLALAHRLSTDDPIWKQAQLQQWLTNIIGLVNKEFPYHHPGSPDSYLWAYNPAGFEIAFALHEFGDLPGLETCRTQQKRWVELQIKGYYDFDSGLMNKHTSDPAVLASRMYEAIRLPDMELEL
ncbi:MAG: hypothetical protein GY765_04500, partial [bacterium]|nr:hypothetical protein [bacterium]